MLVHLSLKLLCLGGEAIGAIQYRLTYETTKSFNARRRCLLKSPQITALSFGSVTSLTHFSVLIISLAF